MNNNFNLFEPSLDITTPYLPYEDLGIQGVWPRNHKIPADIFPTFAHIGGTNVEKTKVHTASFTDDRRLRVDTGSSGGGSPTVSVAQYDTGFSGSAIGGSGAFYDTNIGLIGFETNPTALSHIQLQFTVLSCDNTTTSPQVLGMLTNDPLRSIVVPLFYYIVGTRTAVFGDGRYIIDRTFIPAIDMHTTFGADVIPLVHLQSSGCTWVGGFYVNGILQ